MKILAVFTFLIALALGWLVAGSGSLVTGSERSGEVFVGEQKPERKVERRVKAWSERGPGEMARKRMAAMRASRDPSERMRATVDLVGTLSPSEFADWVDGGWFAFDGVELTLFTKLIEERWVQEDAEGFILWAVKNGSNRENQLLNSWAKNDPQRLVNFFRENPGEYREYGLLSVVAKHDPALALERAIELGKMPDYELRKILVEVAKSSPGILEGRLDSFSFSMRNEVEGVLIGQQLKENFEEGFFQLLDRQDGVGLWHKVFQLANQEEQNAYQEEILQRLDDLPSYWVRAIVERFDHYVSEKNAEQWFYADLEGLGLDEESVGKVRSRALLQMKGNPELALELLPEIEMRNWERSRFLKGIFEEVKDDQARVEQLLAKLGEKDLEEVRGYLDQTTKEHPRIETPSEWLGHLSATSADDAEVLPYGGMSWDADAMAQLSRDFQALPDASKRQVAENIVENYFNSYRNVPLEAEAIRVYLESDREGGRGVEVATQYVAKIVRKNPTEAGQWVNSLPVGEAKQWAQKNLYSQWSQFDPDAADGWFAGLPEGERVKVK